MTDLVIRALTEGDAQLFHTLHDPTASLLGHDRFGRPYATVAAGGEYRPDWTWVALRDGVVVARAAWWAGPDDTRPIALDRLDFAPGEGAAAAELLRAASLSAEYVLMLPPGWRAQPDVRAAAEARMAVVRAAGLRPMVERFRYDWTPECGVPAAPGRLVFRPEPDDEVILDVLRQVERGSLDAHARQAVAAGGVEQAAREELEFFHWCPSPRDWWRVAYTPEGKVVGLHVPARNHTSPVVGFIGVVPAQRGHGYAYDLLVDCTRHLAALGVDRIVAETDQHNTPMAAAFAKAGYPVTQERAFFDG
ncbi:GNAT family N-acetyltransferase [Streptomyces purpurogeneiscleroticus]|uniref:GNAT family N-acetyltransferase n=1 Tax=Streptomyces purpurogeneiscleroticus TaxID=68259 RepID=UPI001CC1593F|nr:GNAT family N-acetyltransferase [Streptomyces purpurogeneiscleroticus]MBZ4018334.1 GNAT family N-acetyltransferase [Streptomyces purpurogeneiscleroticus]